MQNGDIPEKSPGRQTSKRFEDHFSGQARTYASFRPQYPDELFRYLASLAPQRRLAWDCGTGSGQAARELARHFDRVIATDASAEQLAHAVPHERIAYRVERAEEVHLPAGSVDLVTVAIAVHWFDFEAFYRAVRRVAARDAAVAVWTYHLPATEAAIDAVLRHYHGTVLAGFWPERIRYVDERYRTLPFPFAELEPPDFTMETDWDLRQLVGFLESWSATQRYQRERGRNPVETIWDALTEAWGDPARRRRLEWPLHLRVGRVA